MIEGQVPVVERNLGDVWEEAAVTEAEVVAVVEMLLGPKEAEELVHLELD